MPLSGNDLLDASVELLHLLFGDAQLFKTFYRGLDLLRALGELCLARVELFAANSVLVYLTFEVNTNAGQFRGFFGVFQRFKVGAGVELVDPVVLGIDSLA